MENKVAISFYAESTPNPSVLKFVANRLLVERGSIFEFRNIEEAKPSPLVTKLFYFPFVKEVFISDNYISIAKFDIVDWPEVMHEIREYLTEHFKGGNPVFESLEAAEQMKMRGQKLQEVVVPQEGIERKIVDILDEYVKPAVAQDGGNIMFKNYDQGRVHVVLQGACSGCPSSTITLKNGIENMLKQMLPGQITEVVAEGV